MDRETRRMIERIAQDHVEFDAPLAGCTTFGLGGPARALVGPESVDELAAVLAACRQKKLPVFILGGGSNVLVLDGGYPGLVLRLGNSFAGIRRLESDGSHVLVEAGAAEPTARLVEHTRKRGWSGLECLAGIPGWVGGALAMNAGTRDGRIMDAVARLEVLTAEGRTACFERNDLEAGYRRLDLPKGAVILKGVFRLTPGEPDAVAAGIKAVMDRRGKSQPKGVRSAGCIFKNPPGDFAGRLIDRAGLKGKTAGGAWIAGEHANFIVHRGNATAGDVVALMELARSAVRERFDVELEPEILVIGTTGDETR